ncbi:MAG: pilus assembly protein [Chloroflexota bacterium]|nr:pilus assembly protein [Chloroflexota bacterium]
MRPTLRRRRDGSRSRGQALAEFALVMPIFVLLLFGLIDVGRVVYINNAAAQAAREGARWGSVQGRSVDAGGRASIRDYTLGTMNAVPNPTVTVSCERDGSAIARCRTNDILVVTVQSPVSIITPLVQRVFGSVNVSATSRVVVNQ